MKFTTDREHLLSRLQLVSRAVSTRSAIPTLSGILVAARQGSVLLQATDMEIGLSLELDAAPETEGSTVLPGRLLVDIIRSLSGEQVSLELRSEQRDVEIVSGSARFAVRALPAEEFPKLPAAEGEAISLPAPLLIESIERVARAASRDEARPILTGVHVGSEDGVLTMVATDSYRLSLRQTEVSGGIPSGLEANIPARALRELSRIAAAEEGETVDVHLLGNQVVFAIAGVSLSSRLIDGQFPNYRQLLPESFEHEVRLPREELLEVVRRVSLLAQKNAPLQMAFAEGELTVSAETPDVGAASESLPANFSGEKLEIGFNPDFLREGLECIPGEEIVFKLISPLRPGLIEPVDGEKFRYLVMPIRLNA